MRSFFVLALAGTVAAICPMKSLILDRRSVIAAGVVDISLAANPVMDNMHTANGRLIDSSGSYVLTCVVCAPFFQFLTER